jgi:hypothetical protein
VVSALALALVSPVDGDGGGGDGDGGGGDGCMDHMRRQADNSIARWYIHTAASASWLAQNRNTYKAPNPAASADLLARGLGLVDATAACTFFFFDASAA